MDPRLVRGVLVLGAIALYVWSGGKVPMTLGDFLHIVSVFVIGGAAIRRPGDLEPIREDAP